MNTLTLLDELTSPITYNAAFVKRVSGYRMDYLIKNSEFFSKAYTGHVPLYFKTSEVSHFFEVICEIDEANFIRARKQMEGVNLSFKITSDHFNLLLMFIAHKAVNLKTKDGDKLAYEVCTIFTYRTLAALISSRFSKYNATESEAFSTYENLTNQFILKQVKTWANYCDYRVTKALDKTNVFKKRLLRPGSTKEFLVLITRMQSAISSTFNIIYGTHLDTIKNKQVTNQTDQVEIEYDTEVLSTSSSSEFAKIEQIVRFITEPAFINDDILKIVYHVYPSLNISVFSEGIRAYQKAVVSADHAKYTGLVRNLLAWVLTFTQENSDKLASKNVIEVTQYLKGVIQSSRSSDPTLLAWKELADTLLGTIFKTRDYQILRTHRTSFVLYLFLTLKLGKLT